VAECCQQQIDDRRLFIALGDYLCIYNATCVMQRVERIHLRQLGLVFDTGVGWLEFRLFKTSSTMFESFQAFFKKNPIVVCTVFFHLETPP